MTELWFDAKDNDYYTRELSKLSCFRDLANPSPRPLIVDRILRKLYLKPMSEQLSRPNLFDPPFLPYVSKCKRLNKRKRWWQR